MKLPAFVLIAGLLAGCTSTPSGEAETVDSNAREITRAEFGSDWPFTVERGILKCENSAIIFIANGKSYGINGIGISLGEQRNYPKVEEIWAMDSAFMETVYPDGVPEGETVVRISIGKVINEGLALCEPY